MKAKFSNRKANFLPSHICKAFQQELEHLVSNLEDSPKTRYLQTECFSKYRDDSLVSADERRAAAVQKWMTVELANRRTNTRILFGEEFGYASSEQIVRFARDIIKRVLGPLETSTLLRGGTHTNGASTRVGRSSIAAYQKHDGEAHVTPQALKHWFTATSGTMLAKQPLALMESSVLFTVPKSSDIDRVACKEPEINMFLQRIVGSHIRRRLRRAGIDLNDQTRNQQLARRAYVDGLATVDLSSASDSITRSLVVLLLPTEWWSLLDDLRVHSVLIDGEPHAPEMFSSMGNGFTFELESLIFWALTRAVCYFSGVNGTISIYGDDIICPASVGPRLARTFSWFGFKVNPKKSNWSGPLRESCGKHYHRGLDITPFYLKEPVRRMTDVIRLLNQLLLWDSEHGMLFLITPAVIEFHKKWSKIVPVYLHGGVDPSSDGSLVTGDRPRKRLIAKTKSRKFCQLAGITYWLTVKESSLPSSADWAERNAGSVRDPLECDPVIERGYRVADQPNWLYSTAWDPYLLTRI